MTEVNLWHALQGGQHALQHLKLMTAAGVQHWGEQGPTMDVLASNKSTGGLYAS